jgi:hypothetical protein
MNKSKSHLDGRWKMSITCWNSQILTVVLDIASVNHSQKMVLPHGRQKLKAKVVKLFASTIACFKSHDRPEALTYCWESSPIAMMNGSVTVLARQQAYKTTSRRWEHLDYNCEARTKAVVFIINEDHDDEEKTFC